MKKHIFPIISLVCLIVVICTLLYQHFEKGGVTGRWMGDLGNDDWIEYDIY